MKIVEAAEARARLTPEVCISLMREAFIALESGRANQPLRSIVKWQNGEQFGFMPAYLGADDCFGAKVITAFPQNAGTQYPTHMGYVMMFDSQHGAFAGMADGSVITEVRTGAVSAVATDLLARKDARKLAIIGAGAQGRGHLAAILRVRDIDSVTVYDRVPEAAQRYAGEMGAKHGVQVTVCSSCEECVRDADIICTLTPSKEPYLRKEWIRPGAHINAVGTFTPTTREVTSELVAASKFYSDYTPSTVRECGEYLIPLAEGCIREGHIVGSIGEVLLGKAPGRESDEEITLFDALGLAVEDVICARYLCSDDN